MKNVKLICMIIGLLIAFIPACVSIIITTIIVYVKKTVLDVIEDIN